MKLIHSSAEYLPQEPGLDGIYKQIELAGRTSYLSWDKMSDDSAKKFVDMLIKSKHTSVLEHGTVYLVMPLEYGNTDHDICQDSRYDYVKYSKYSNTSFSIVNDILEDVYPRTANERVCKKGYYISTNLRVLLENGWMDDLKYLCEPTEYHEKRLSVKVITDIGVTREFNRHRTFSIVEQSTRQWRH